MDDGRTAAVRQRRQLDQTMTLHLGLGLFFIAIAAKFILLPFAVGSFGEFARWLLRLGIVVAADVCFVAAMTAVCWTMAGLAAPWRRTAAAWRLATLLLFQLAGVYEVASVRIVRVMSEMLSVRLLAFAGEPGVMASSIAGYVTPELIAALVVAFIVPLVLKDELRRLRLNFFLGWKSGLAAMCLLGLYGGVAHAYVARQWNEPNRWERKIAGSPHYVLLESCLGELISSGKLEGRLDLREGDLDDFADSGTRLPEKLLPQVERAFAADRPKNVVLIVMESVGAEYMSLYGGRHETNPRLSKLAAEQGVIFDNYYVQCPYSCNSLVALTAGIYPSCDWQVICRDNPNIGVPLIHEALLPHGYRSCYLHSGFWSWKGRDKYFGRGGSATLIDAETLPGPFVNSWGVSDRQMYRAALEWIDRDRQQPFFLLAFTIETHHPYAAPKQPLDFGVPDESLGRYLNAIRGADEQIAWMIDELKSRGLADDTLIVVTSDHGESFGQHGQRHHGFGVYEQQMRVPLLMLHPSLKDGPRRITAVRQQIDLAPTLVSLLGHETPAAWQGRHLLRNSDDDRAYFFSVGPNVAIGLRDNRFKYHYYVNSATEELFDLTADPEEKTNVAQSFSDECRAYRRKLAGFVGHQRKFLAELGTK